MKNNLLLIILITLFVIFAILVVRNNINRQPAFSLGPKLDENGDVVVRVTPVVMEAGKQASFQVLLDTHNVELDYNLLELSKLYDNRGKMYKPLSWDGGSGGHHLSGKLVFEGLDKDIRNIKLEILNISGFDRRFEWSL